MKIGTCLTVKEINSDSAQYSSKLIDYNDHYIHMTYPIHKLTKKTTFFSSGTTLLISYIGTDEAIYQFETKIVSNVKSPIPALMLEQPTKDAIKRIQRRNFVRVETTIDIAIHSPNHSFLPFTTVTADISGGGLQMVIPHDIDIPEDELLDIWLTLHWEKDKFEYLHLQGKIVRIRNNHAIKNASVKFTSIDIQDQQKIIQFCFLKEREARRKKFI